MTSGSTTLPRSFLYVPANRAQLFDKASAGPADAIVLDLEDAVPLADKPRARQDVARWLDKVAATAVSTAHAQCWVRVSAESTAEDLDAVVRTGLDGIFLAKCSLAALEQATHTLDDLEQSRGLPEHSVGVVGLVESADAMLDLASMARIPRLVTFGIGEVDLLADLRIARTSRSAAAVDLLRTQVVLHCAAEGLRAPVAPTSTAYRDLDAFAETTRQMLDLGFRSRTAIHPSQVSVIHEVFTPSEHDVEAALDVMRRFESANGGITTDASGRLIDPAVVREARETLARRPRH